MGLLQELSARRRRVAVLLPRPDASGVDVDTYRLLAALADQQGVDGLAEADRPTWERLQAARGDLFTVVPLASIGADEFERLTVEHRGKDGALIWSTALPALLAACCEDPDAQNADEWSAVLAAMPVGDVATLRKAVWDVNHVVGAISGPLAG